MRSFATYILVLTSMSICAQKSLDTIYVNDKMNVSLFFPSPIRQGIAGADHFVFTYNRDKEQYFGLLQARPGTESNLLAVTNDGQVYSYILKYQDTIAKLNYFISKKKSIGQEKPVSEIPKIENDTIAKKKVKTLYLKRFSEHVSNTKGVPLATRRKKGIRFRLLNVTYNKNEVYLVMEIKNKSGIDFEMDYLNISIINKNNKRASSSQQLRQEIIYEHGVPQRILNNSSKRFVYVLPKFVLGDDEKLLIKVKELKGSRSITLKSNL
ncbi:DUF4138 domain-containing protein [Yeosuana marina]|uniref:DUF4138 domain-containing protein n=1 Tax=Yeosuana marina TaxID=1565536 RepID=UPI0014249294|nr:DUF4138 domain-containing protein [Yeosuana marina]